MAASAANLTSSCYHLLDELLEVSLNGAAPDVVALGAEVQVVGHDLARNAAVGREEVLADVLVEDVLPVGVGGNNAVDRGDLLVELVSGHDLRLGIGVSLASAREDTEHEDLH